MGVLKNIANGVDYGKDNHASIGKPYRQAYSSVGVPLVKFVELTKSDRAKLRVDAYSYIL